MKRFRNLNEPLQIASAIYKWGGDLASSFKQQVLKWMETKFLISLSAPALKSRMVNESPSLSAAFWEAGGGAEQTASR